MEALFFFKFAQFTVTILKKRSLGYRNIVLLRRRLGFCKEGFASTHPRATIHIQKQPGWVNGLPCLSYDFVIDVFLLSEIKKCAPFYLGKSVFLANGPFKVYQRTRGTVWHLCQGLTSYPTELKREVTILLSINFPEGYHA